LVPWLTHARQIVRYTPSPESNEKYPLIRLATGHWPLTIGHVWNESRSRSPPESQNAAVDRHTTLAIETPKVIVIADTQSPPKVTIH